MMKMKKIHLIHIILLSSIGVVVKGQVVAPISYNHAIKCQLTRQSTGLKSTTSERIAPPFPSDDYYFFDDFLYYQESVYPDQTLWEDQYAYVNQTYADSCISIGVATLDGIDENGDLYSTSDGNTAADTLTSMDISLDGVTDNVYFSFFYEGGGKGDAPDTKDSLVLEFYNSNSEKWYQAWYSLGIDTNNFIQVALEIDDTLKNDPFKFRFRNRVSTKVDDASGEDESSITNTDFWHIDYVQLRKAESIDDMYILNDATIVFPLLPTHEYYNALPYRHLSYSQADRKEKSQIYIRTNFTDISSSTVTIRRDVLTYNVYDGQQILVGGLVDDVAENEQELKEVISYSDYFAPGYTYSDDQKYGDFEYVSYIDKVTEDDYQWNDTIKKQEVFKDYYAYDDGTAEYGFGMPGNGGINMRLAYKYPLANRNENPEDTLSAIDIHFVKTRNNASGDMEFQVCIWGTDGDEPGDLLYPEINDDGELEGSTYTVDTTLGINEFLRIDLDNELLVKDTIYIGLVQLTTGSLSIGYDINSNSRSSIYTNDGNKWLQAQNSIPKGSLMMRPVFGNIEYTSVEEVTDNVEQQENSFKVYPNPVRDYVYIALTNDVGIDMTDYSLSVYNMMGQCVVFENTLVDNIDLSQYPEGMYFVKINNLSTSESEVHRILKIN